MLTFEEFKERHALWRECLCGEDPNSISSQIPKMLWDAAVWRLIVKCRSTVSESVDGKKQINTMIHKLIDKCFIESQILAIRRLIDPYGRIEDQAASSNRSIYSLISLLEDIKIHRESFNRENIFLIEGLEYSYEKAMTDLLNRQESKKHDLSFEAGIISPDEPNPFMTQNRHETIDFLTGTSPNTRKTTDHISEIVIDNLKDRLKNAAKKASDYGNKYIAHAATPQSRASVIIDDISMKDVWDAERIICQTAHFLTSALFKTHVTNFVPIQPSGYLEYIEIPLVENPDVSQLDKFWDEFINEVKTWQNWKSPQVLEEIQKSRG